MIFGIGTDIVQCSRFSSWINNQKKCESFFNQKEMPQEKISDQRFMEHLASRYAAKEAFVKALGTGFSDFKFNEIFITNDSAGKPILNVENKAADFLKKIAGEVNIFVTLSHEKDFATAFVIIEKKEA